MFPRSTAAGPRVRRSADIAYLGACALFVVAPFERVRPLLALPGQNVTTVEAAILTAAGAWLVALVAYGERPIWKTPVTWPWLTWLVVAALAALIAPAFRLNAAKVVGRLTAGLFIVLMTVNGVTTERRLAGLIWLAAGSAVVVAALATLEYSGASTVLRWLSGFRESAWVVGGQVRASGTLQYPTIASMYFEIAFALALGAFLASVDRRAALAVAILFIGLAVIAEGVVVTLTRAGLITMAVSLALAGGWRYRRDGLDRGVAGLGALAGVIVLLVASSASAESIRLRLTTEGQRDWYHAAFLTPATLTMTTGAVHTVQATVINTGRVTWEPDAQPPFHVSYHWFDESLAKVVNYDGLRTPLPRAVAPGDSLVLDVEVRAPFVAGSYTLGWDVVQEGRLWFSTEPGSRLALSKATVSGEPVSPAVPPRIRRSTPPPQAVRVGRLTLWSAALQMAAIHPLLGIGPDNFRLSYGPYAQLAEPDLRVTSNNMYLEVLTGAGAIGLAAFLWVCWRAAGTIRQTVARLSSTGRSLYTGVAAAALAIGIHGLLDSFLTLTPTYLVMSLTLGLAMAPAAWSEAA